MNEDSNAGYPPIMYSPDEPPAGGADVKDLTTDKPVTATPEFVVEEATAVDKPVAEVPAEVVEEEKPVDMVAQIGTLCIGAEVRVSTDEIQTALQDNDKLNTLLEKVNRVARAAKEYYGGLSSQSYAADQRGAGTPWNHQELDRLSRQLQGLETLQAALEKERSNFLHPKDDADLSNLESIAVAPERFNFGVIQKMPEFMQSDLMVKLVEKAKSSSDRSRQMLMHNIDKFQNLNSEAALALLTIKFENAVTPLVVARNIEHFRNMNNEVALKLLGGNGEYMACYEIGHGGIDSFDNNLSNEVADILIDHDYLSVVLGSLDKFPNANKEYWTKLIEKRHFGFSEREWIENKFGI